VASAAGTNSASATAHKSRPWASSQAT